MPLCGRLRGGEVPDRRFSNDFADVAVLTPGELLSRVQVPSSGANPLIDLPP
jgi:hypothetical protein